MGEHRAAPAQGLSLDEFFDQTLPIESLVN
jgi:hypothetical protein